MTGCSDSDPDFTRTQLHVLEGEIHWVRVEQEGKLFKILPFMALSLNITQFSFYDVTLKTKG